MCTIPHYQIVHARFLEAYIYFEFMYTKDHIFPVITIKVMINKDGEPPTPFILATCVKPSVSH